MIDAQQENGTDEAPERDVRWEGKLARLENKAHEHNRVGLDWKTIEVEAGTLERILTEREAYQIELQLWRRALANLEEHMALPADEQMRRSREQMGPLFTNAPPPKNGPTSGMARLSPDEMQLRR